MSKPSTLRHVALASAAALSLGLGSQAQAADIAIFGNNNIASFYGGLVGHTVTVVGDSQLATAGFLDAYDLFVYTRDGYSFGTSLSAAAAANVKSFVKGNVVLLNGDFQDDIGTASTNALFTNVLNYVASNPLGGYIGEYTGSFAAFATNQSGLAPIGLVNGDSGPSGYHEGGSDGEVQLTAIGAASATMAGVGFPYNPGAVEFGASATGVNPAKVLAVFDNGNVAIVASGVEQISNPVPEPETYAMMAFGLAALAFVARRRRQQA